MHQEAFVPCRLCDSPSPARVGEGRGEGQTKPLVYSNPLIPAFSLEGEGVTVPA